MFYFLFLPFTLFLSLQSAQLMLTDIHDDCIKHIASFAYTPHQQAQELLDRIIPKKSAYADDDEYLEDVRKNGPVILETLYYAQLSSPVLLCTNKKIYSILKNDFLLNNVHENIYTYISQLPAYICKAFVDVFYPYKFIIKGYDPYRELDSFTSTKKIESDCVSDWWLEHTKIMGEPAPHDIDILQNILSNGGDPKELNKYGYNFAQTWEKYAYPLDNVHWKSYMESCKNLIDLYDFKHLTDKSDKIPNLINGTRWPTLLCMMYNSERNIIKDHVYFANIPRILYRYTKDVNTVDTFGRCFLSYALNFPFESVRVNKYILELLIEMGADINVLSKGEQHRIKTEFAYIFQEHRLEKELHKEIIKAMKYSNVTNPQFINEIHDWLRRGANPNVLINNKNAIDLVLAGYCTDYLKACIIGILLNYDAQWLSEYQFSTSPSSEWIESPVILTQRIRDFAQQPTHSGVRLSYDYKLSVMKLLDIFKQPFKNE